MWPWRVKMSTQNLLRLLLLLMLMMRIVLATVCCRFGSWDLVSLAVWGNLLVVISGSRFIFLCMKWMWKGKEYGDKTSRNWYLSPGDLKSINQSHSDWHQRWNLRSDKKTSEFSTFLLKENADSDICEQTTLNFSWSLLLRVLFVNFSALISIHQGPTTHSNFKTFRSKGRSKDVLKTHHQSKNLLSSRKRQSWF